MKLYYDLHIHSALSPCADESMTPNNIVLMAKIKGLDMISLTDHNSVKNMGPVAKICEKENILFIPGIEIETIEGVHLLCYTDSLEAMMKIGEVTEKHLGMIENRPEFFGTQWVMNEKDEVIERVKPLLIQSTTLTIQDVIKLVHEIGGVVIAAHLNKREHSILTNLGFIPQDLLIDGFELNAYVLKKDKDSPKWGDYLVFINSDAHQLGDISEAENVIILENKSRFDFFSYVKKEEK